MAERKTRLRTRKIILKMDFLQITSRVTLEYKSSLLKNVPELLKPLMPGKAQKNRVKKNKKVLIKKIFLK